MTSAPVAATSAGAQRKRLAEVDTLRGFALFGILVTNVIVVSSFMTITADGDELTPIFDGSVDRGVSAVVHAFFLGKFYLLFSFLFGYSFTLQLDAAARDGASAVRRLLRRCGALFLIGLAHVTLLWFGDILTLYAVLCLILTLLRNIRPVTAIIVGCVLMLAYSGLFLLDTEGKSKEEGLSFLDLAGMHEAYTGSFADTFAVQLSIAPLFMALIWAAQGLPALAAFLFGLAAGKRGLFEDRERVDRWIPRALLIGLFAGVPVAVWAFVVQLRDAGVPWYLSALEFATNPLLTAAYIAGILWLARSRIGDRLVSALAPAGRMAATNYIGQSVVFMAIYTGYGFALADVVPPLGLVGIALVTFAAQLAFSRWWLGRHVYGPLEWLLRAATNFKIPSWRRR